jgi:ABC-type multidrug transport system ATPase subunit
MVPWDFLAGAAVIALPQYQVPLLVGTAAAKAVLALKDTRHHDSIMDGNGDGAGHEDESQPPQQEVTLRWHNISCQLETKGGDTKQLLSIAGSTARPGRLLAIIGPSGAGKTTLLAALAGQVPVSQRMRLSGSVTVNGTPIDRSGHRQGYVQQEDIFYSQLTVRETLTMAAHLRLPKTMSDSKRDKYVEDLISRLGLVKSADTIVGDAKTRGISGGEKKRLSIGCELIASPSLVFADEPTSGLDSFQAQRVMQTLKDLASEGKTVVCSIHQPRSSIFEMFDDLLLLSEGQEVYMGPAAEAGAHFEALGHPCPPHYNPAEFYADLISVDPTNPETEQRTRQRIQQLVDAFKQKQAMRQLDDGGAVPEDDTALSQSSAADATPTAGWRRQFRLLLSRSWRQATRDKATNFARAGTNISSALIFGSIYFRMRRTQSTVQDRIGLLQVSAINAAMSSLVKTLNVFPRERTIVTRERSKKAYDVLPYFGAKLAAELPVGAVFPLLFGAVVYPLTGLNPRPSRFGKFLGILTLESFAASALGLAVGSVAPSTEAALAMGPAVMVIFIVFGGVYVNSENVPRALKWLPNISLIKHCFEALCVNEFRGLDFETRRRPGEVATGEQALERVGFGDSTIKGCALGQARVLVFAYWLTYNILKSRKPKFQPLEEASEATPGPNGDQEADFPRLQA